MKVKYALVFNKQSEHTSHYVVFEKENKVVKSMLPVSYFWLKHYGLEENAFEYADEWDNVWFEIIWLQDVSVVNKKYPNLYAKYYELLNVSPVVFKENIHYLGSFLEHYVYRERITDEIERIKESIFVYYLKKPNYIETIGTFIYELTKNNKAIKNEDYLKIAFSDELSGFEPYLYLKE